MTIKWTGKYLLYDKPKPPRIIYPVVPLDEHEKKVEQMQQQLNESADNALEWQLKYVKLLFAR